MGQPLKLKDAGATESLAATLARALPEDAKGWTILLEGELGAGKSTFARAMLRTLGHEGTVPSPTYTLVEPYEFPNYTAYHIDLYRVNSEDELEFLGWSDMQDGLKLIEWPERAPRATQAADIRVELRYAGSGREADITGLSERGAAIAGKLARLPSEVPS